MTSREQRCSSWLGSSWVESLLQSSFVGAIICLAVLAAACGSDTLVGGGCKEGLAECSLKCVDLSRDSNNCGVCGHGCAAGVTCVLGVCGGDGGMGDAGTDDAKDGSDFDVGPGDVMSSDGVSGDGSPTDGGPVCPPPFDTPEHCGDCSTRCVDPTPLCGLSGTFKCVSRCEAPLVACGAACVDTFSDENNCGMCGKICASGICQGGSCVGKGYGHEIVIGMDYTDGTLSQSSAQVTMLGNAVFLGGTANVRVLAYDEFADPATVVRIRSWLSAMAMGRGKTITIDEESYWSGVSEELTVASYDVFLVYDQLSAPADRMATNGTLWHGAMSGFARGGGIIVVLDGGSAGRVRDLLTNGGLLPVLDETDVTSTQLDVNAPTDVVGLNLPNVFVAKKSTIGFTTTQAADNLHVFVVKDDIAMKPIVVHSVPPP